jgi:hypothetical protein
MHDGRKKSIAGKISKLVENAEDPLTSRVNIERVIFRDGVSYKFTAGYVELLDNLIKELMIKDRYNEKFSETHIRSEIESITSKLIKERNLSKLNEYIDLLVLDLESYCPMKTVYLPLFGIDLVGDTIKIGKVTLRRMDDYHTNILIERFTRVIDKSQGDASLKKSSIRREIELIDKYIRNRTCALFEVGAEADKALELAEKETQRVIELFRYAIPALYSSDKRVVIGLQGEYSGQLRHVPIISATDESCSIKNYRVGPLFPLELSPENIDIMNKIGVFILGELLERDELNDFEETLLLSIEWFSRSQTQIEKKNRLLNLITCMETLLNPGGVEPIQKSISQGVAIILNDDPLRRKKLKDRIIELYKFRSTVIHGRKNEILNSDIRELTHIVGSLIMVLIKMKDQCQFESKNDLANWIEYRIFGGSPENWMDYRKSLIIT